MGIRTTITLDNDVFERLKRVSSETGGSFREVVNATLRRGLLAQEQAGAEPALTIRSVSMGTPSVPIIKVGDALASYEGPLHR